jgi:hypothetical protein
MGRQSSLRRFKANPIEYGIFATVTLLFAHSMYSLLYTYEDFQFTALTPMASNPLTESREPAASTPAFANVTLNCEGTAAQATRSPKLLLTGPLCEEAIEKTSVINDTNRFTATVFTDIQKNRFSTDYIPLNTGRNVIKVEFAQKNGKTSTKELVINRE